MASREECRSVARHLWSHLDGELPEALHERIAAHLRGCSTCRSHVDFERRFLAAIRLHVRRSSDAELAPLRARVVYALACENLRSHSGTTAWEP
jgi:anti-sigma factor (TIGR02949 family)